MFHFQFHASCREQPSGRGSPSRRPSGDAASATHTAACCAAQWLHSCPAQGSTDVAVGAAVFVVEAD